MHFDEQECISALFRTIALKEPLSFLPNFRLLIPKQKFAVMKKTMLAAVLMLFFAAFSFGQFFPDKTTTTDKKATTATAKSSTSTPAKASTSTASKASTATTSKTASTAGPTKKDGTADMRYKANKEAAKPTTTHVKKDGTPDKRYKENKPPK